MTHIISSEIMLKIKSYIKENWGSPFIIAFMVLLISTAVFLSAGLSYIADTIAIYAFYALVTGVVLQFVSLLRCRKVSETGAN